MGQNDAVGLAKQTDFATKKTTMDFWLPLTAENIGCNREELAIDETLGTRAPSDRVLGGKMYEGSMGGAVRPAGFGLLCAGAFGAPTTTTLTTGAYQHVYNPHAAGRVPLPLSVFTYNADPTTTIRDLFWGCYVNELEVKCEANGYMTFTAGIVGAQLDDTQSAPTATMDSTSKFPFDQLTATIAVNGGAAGAINLANFRLKWLNNMEPAPFVLGSTAVSSFTPGNVGIELDFETIDTLSTHYRRALLDTQDAVAVVVKAEGATIASTYKYTVQFDLKKARYVSAPIDIDAGSTLTKVAVQAKGVYDDSSSKSLETTIKNATASY